MNMDIPIYKVLMHIYKSKYVLLKNIQHYGKDRTYKNHLETAIDVYDDIFFKLEEFSNEKKE